MTTINDDISLAKCLRLALASFLCGIGALGLHGQNNLPRCTVEVTKPGAAVADICRGQQIEEFNHQFAGGF